jgi:chromosome partitioning protein
MCWANWGRINNHHWSGWGMNNKLGSSIAVMNAKGGVGKSTVTLAIAETLSCYFDKKVLVIDSDAQMSISVMLMPFEELNSKRANWETLVGLLHQTLILGEAPDWKDFITSNVSDVDDTETVDLLPGDLRLTLVERAVTEADRHEQMRGLVRSVLAEAQLIYDFILIDCPPGLSLLTEIWLREADFHLAPAKPDFLAIAGLEMFREFKKINPELKMAENLGILVNMKNLNSAEDDKYHSILANDEESRCFPEAIPHMAPIQHAARFSIEERSFTAKYPGSAGEAFRNTVQEVLRRTEEAEKLRVHEVEEPQIIEEFVAEAALVEEVIAEATLNEALAVEVPQFEPEVQVDPQRKPVAAPRARPGAVPEDRARKGTIGNASRFAPPTDILDEVSALAGEVQAMAMAGEVTKPAPAPAPLTAPRRRTETPARTPNGLARHEVR